MSKFTEKLEDIFDREFVIYHIVSRIIVLLPVAVIAWWIWYLDLYSMFDPSPREVWQQRADSLPALTTDRQIADAIAGEPRTYLIKNYCFQQGTTIRDTLFQLLTGEYMLIDIHSEVHTRRGYGDNKTDYWADRHLTTLFGGLSIGNGTPVQNADSLTIIFSSANYWQNLTDDEVDHNKLGHVQQKMYYYPDRTMNLDSIGAIIDEIPEQFHKSVVRTREQLGKFIKTFDTRYTLTFLKRDTPVTFAAVLGNDKADFNAFQDGDNYLLVGCDKVSDTSDYETNFLLGMKIGAWFIAGVLLLMFIFAHKLFQKD
jgi:hypothetical protein